MDSLDRIFGFINEAKKRGKAKAMIPTHHEKKGDKKNFGTGKKNRYDHDHDSFGMKSESKIPVQKPPPKGGKYKPKPPPKDIWIKRKIKEDVVQILGLLKEAYEDELISEEAFLAIADPIIKSLAEGKKIAVKHPETGKTVLVDEDDLEKERRKNADKKPRQWNRRRRGSD